MQFDITILRAKVELFIETLADNPNASVMRSMFLEPLDEMERSHRISRVRLRAIDRGLEKFMNLISIREQRDIRRQLVARFGGPRLYGNNVRVVERIIQRGGIVDDIEAECARSFVSNLQNERIIGLEKFNKLAVILDQAGY